MRTERRRMTWKERKERMQEQSVTDATRERAVQDTTDYYRVTHGHTRPDIRRIAREMEMKRRKKKEKEQKGDLGYTQRERRVKNA